MLILNIKDYLSAQDAGVTTRGGKNDYRDRDCGRGGVALFR